MAEPTVDVSVIVAVRNGAETLAQCIESVLAQKGCALEIIIVDAMSDDGTQDIVKSYGDRIDLYIRERDSGIGDAWNKALRDCRAEWCIFLGADDWLINERSLESLLLSARAPDVRPAFVFGGVVSGDDLRAEVVHPAPRDVTKFVQSGRMLPHQGMLHNASILAQAGGFNPKYRISADLDATLRMLRLGSAERCSSVVAFMRSGGLSSRRSERHLLWLERFEITRQEVGFAAGLAQGVRFRASALLFPVVRTLVTASLGSERGLRVLAIVRSRFWM
jgi:glycosyltransferase involved in cell wall biosynthesis